nr:T9SS type A sorting domain-containing protein [Bacteroidia bacterium]
MKRLTFLLFIFYSLNCFSQAGEWVWVKGDTVTNNMGTYGVQGVSNINNTPPSLYEACEWTDTSGNFWLYGGLSPAHVFADLWRYEVGKNEWTWMKGLHIPNHLGSYGVKGVPSPNNYPPASSFGVNSWVDLNGNFWMFGGSNQPYKVYSDLWKYEIATNEWTWMNGPGVPNTQGVYGVQGISSPSNYPAARTETAASWTDNNGDLWLFGGSVYGTANSSINDMWKYTIATNEWTWVKGDSIPNQRGVYGTRGVEGANNTPGGRWVYPNWKDDNGNLWCFGGYESWNSMRSNKIDFWKFNVQSMNWTWMDGDTMGNTFGVNGPMCMMNDLNIPSMATECRASWKDSKGNFWGVIVGDGYYNSLWKYCPKAEQWAMISADSSLQGCPRWGVRGVSSPTNSPPALQGPIGWTDGSDRLYMFGGLSGCGLWSNAIWVYTIDSTCGVCALTTEVQTISEIESGFSVFPNPTKGTFELSLDFKTQVEISDVEVYNLIGEKVYTVRITGSRETIDCNLSKGIYSI